METGSTLATAAERRLFFYMTDEGTETPPHIYYCVSLYFLYMVYLLHAYACRLALCDIG